MMKKSIFGEKIKIIMVVCALLSTGSLPVLQDSYESYATSVTLSQKQIMLTDIKGHWAEQVIQKLVSEKAIAGYPDGSYRPNKSITNAELASIIAGAVKLAPKEKKNTHWASGVFEALYDKGIQPVDYPEKDYDRAINRYQMIKLLILVNENIQSHPSVEASDAKGAIADYASIPESYKYYVEQAVKKGFIRGDQYQRINGSSTTTRAEAAVIIDKLKTAKAGQTVTPTPVPQQPTPAPNQPQQPTPAPNQPQQPQSNTSGSKLTKLPPSPLDNKDLSFLKKSRLGIDYSASESELNAQGFMSEDQARVALYHLINDPDNKSGIVYVPENDQPLANSLEEKRAGVLGETYNSFIVDTGRFQRLMLGDPRSTPEWERNLIEKIKKGGQYIYHEKLHAYSSDDPKQGYSYTLAMEVRTQGNKKQYRAVMLGLPAGRVAEGILGGYISDWHDFATAWND